MTSHLIPVVALLLALGASAQAQEPVAESGIGAGAPWAFWGFVVNAPDTPDLVSQFKR